MVSIQDDNFNIKRRLIGKGTYHLKYTKVSQPSYLYTMIPYPEMRSLHWISSVVSFLEYGHIWNIFFNDNFMPHSMMSQLNDIYMYRNVSMDPFRLHS